MTERANRIPQIAQREDGIDRAMPLTLFDAASTDAIFKREKGLTIPEDSKVVFEVSLRENSDYHPRIYTSLGTIRLREDFEGLAAGRIAQPYAQMPDKSSLIMLLPDSDERRKTVEKIASINKSNEAMHRYHEDPKVARALRTGLSNKELYNRRIGEIDNELQRDFLEKRQDDLEFFNIDPREVIIVRLLTAVNKKLNDHDYNQNQIVHPFARAYTNRNPQ